MEGRGGWVDIDASSPVALLRLAVLSASSAQGAGLRAVPLADAATYARLGLIARRDQQSPAVRLLRARLRAALRSD
ncbi:hypothetical protein ACGF12_23630 [Kitasatospora sp. NPDC048296]|uniref:hypothetical protein n=1 Tax=Kitasatospora sp. NPDC048296 TaxID=3364048 RepID=UPI003713A2DF